MAIRGWRTTGIAKILRLSASPIRWRRNFARDEITVNAICPGVVRTAMWDLLAEEWRNDGETAEESWQRQVLAFVPQGRPQTTEDIGDLVVYLVSAAT